MNFKEFLVQVERPYWSPLHPRNYICRLEGAGRLKLQGWGMVFPDDIGAFNLMWLMSGVGAPPDDYRRYASLVSPVLQITHFTLGRFTLKHAAAVMPMGKFAERLLLSGNPAFEPVLDALRLRV